MVIRFRYLSVIAFGEQSIEHSSSNAGSTITTWWSDFDKSPYLQWMRYSHQVWTAGTNPGDPLEICLRHWSLHYYLITWLWQIVVSPVKDRLTSSYLEDTRCIFLRGVHRAILSGTGEVIITWSHDSEKLYLPSYGYSFFRGLYWECYSGALKSLCLYFVSPVINAMQ